MLVALGVGQFLLPGAHRLGAGEFSRVEPETGNPFGFGQRPRPGRAAGPPSFTPAESVNASVPTDQVAAPRRRKRHRRIDALAEVRQPGIQQVQTELLDEPLAEVANGGHLPVWQDGEKLEVGVGRFGVGGDGHVGRVVRRHREGGPGHRRRSGNPGELLPDHPLDLVLVEVSHGDDGHQVGPVPVVVEASQRRLRETLQVREAADREAVGIL